MARGRISDEHAAVLAAVVEEAAANGLLPCGGIYGTIVMPDPTDGACCIGSAVMGPQYCTCWVEVFDLEQQEPRPGEHGRRMSPCGDCAYRKDSPERRGDDRYKGSDEGFLDLIVVTGERFWCHVGMRRTVRLAHPSGAVVDVAEAAAGDYRPPIVDGVPYRADGSPGELCAGWAARRRSHLVGEAG